MTALATTTSEGSFPNKHGNWYQSVLQIIILVLYSAPRKIKAILCFSKHFNTYCYSKTDHVAMEMMGEAPEHMESMLGFKLALVDLMMV